MRKYLKQGIALLGEEGSARILSFLVSVYIARSFTKADYGIIIFGTALMNNLINIGDLGMLPLGFAETAKSEKQRLFEPEKIFQTRILGLLTVMLLAIIVTLFSTLSTQHKTVCILYEIAIMVDALNPVWYFKGKQQFNLTTAVKSLTSLAYFLMAFTIIQFFHTVTVIPLVFITTYGVGALFLMRKARFNVNLKLEPIKKEIFRVSAKVGVGKIIQQLPALAPPLLITWFAGISSHYSLENTAGYGASWRLIVAFNIADRIVRSIFLSSLPQQWEKNPERTTEVIRRLFVTMTITGCIIIILLTTFSNTIMSFVYEEKYYENGITLALLSLFLLFSILNSIVCFGILAIGKAQDFMKASVIPTIITLPTLIVLTYFKAENGAALGVVLVEAGIFLSSLFYFKKTVKLPLGALGLLLPVFLFMGAFFFTNELLYRIIPLVLLAIISVPLISTTFKGSLRDI